jgi:hypothetical protein
MFMIFGSIHPSQSFGTNEATFLRPAASVGAVTTDGTEDPSGTGRGEWSSAQGPAHNLMNCALREPWAEATPPLGECNSAVSQPVRPM